MSEEEQTEVFISFSGTKWNKRIPSKKFGIEGKQMA